jgi:rod shape determining protein RodA
LFLPVSFKLLKPYQIARIETFLDFEKDPLGSSYNQIQAIIAAGSGQIFGKGLGKGTQSHLEFLPEKHTDFFFSAFAEEFGFVGSALVLILYFTLSFNLIKLSFQSEDVFLKLIFLGTFFAIFFQTFLHISINVGLLPVTGITLPFMSSGGSSMISLWIILGIASSAARKIKKNYAIYLK